MGERIELWENIPFVFRPLEEFSNGILNGRLQYSMPPERRQFI